jgi:chromosome partitioning protein
MVAIVSCLSQKGGVAKSSLARLVAREYAARGRRVLLGDLDTLQATASEWARRRAEAGIAPWVGVRPFDSVKKAVKAAAGDDLLVLDGRGFADRQTLDVTERSAAVLLPTGLGVDDLLPSVRLAHELVTAGSDRRGMLFVLCRTGDRPAEINEARHYIEDAGYLCLEQVWPERTGYRLAHDEGRVATEARHPSLRRKARQLADSLMAWIDPHLTEAA